MRNLSNFSFKTSWWISIVSRFIYQFRFSYLEFSFWKSNVRKVYAVNKNTFDTQSGATRKTHLNELLNAIKELEKNIKTKIEDTILVPQSRALEEAIWSSQLIEPLTDALKCLICHGICVSPIKASPCCKHLLGCKFCIDNWNWPMCPHCRSEDYSRIEFSAFETVLEILHRNVYTS